MDMDNDALSVSSTLAGSRREWDVFLSFRGEDTRHPFTYELYKSLKKHEVRAFRDDDGMRRGDEIAPSLLEAIEDSAASIVIISPNYASSRWCLQELSKICDCRRLILPVFYRVDPSHVRKQAGPFAEHFKQHENRFGKEKVESWREAMKKAGGTAGWVFDRSDQEIVELLTRKLARVLLGADEGFSSTGSCSPPNALARGLKRDFSLFCQMQFDLDDDAVSSTNGRHEDLIYSQPGVFPPSSRELMAAGPTTSVRPTGNNQAGSSLPDDVHSADTIEEIRRMQDKHSEKLEWDGAFPSPWD